MSFRREFIYPCMQTLLMLIVKGPDCLFLYFVRAGNPIPPPPSTRWPKRRKRRRSLLQRKGTSRGPSCIGNRRCLSSEHFLPLCRQPLVMFIGTSSDLVGRASQVRKIRSQKADKAARSEERLRQGKQRNTPC